MGRDMTESHEVQETLHESAQLAQGIITTALDAFIQVDQHSFIRGWNVQAETMLGWSREALGKNIFSSMGRKDGPGPLQAALQGFLRSGRTRWRNLAARSGSGDGTEGNLHRELSVTALKTRDGFLVQLFQC